MRMACTEAERRTMEGCIQGIPVRLQYRICEGKEIVICNKPVEPAPDGEGLKN